MTKLSALGASLLILSFAAPVLADEAKPAPPKVAAPTTKAAKPPAAKTSDDRPARHAARDDDDKHGENHDGERRHDRD
jgi:hypothetical protein